MNSQRFFATYRKRTNFRTNVWLVIKRKPVCTFPEWSITTHAHMFRTWSCSGRRRCGCSAHEPAVEGDGVGVPHISLQWRVTVWVFRTWACSGGRRCGCSEMHESSSPMGQLDYVTVNRCSTKYRCCLRSLANTRPYSAAVRNTAAACVRWPTPEPCNTKYRCCLRTLADTRALQYKIPLLPAYAGQHPCAAVRNNAAAYVRWPIPVHCSTKYRCCLRTLANTRALQYEIPLHPAYAGQHPFEFWIMVILYEIFTQKHVMSKYNKKYIIDCILLQWDKL